VQRDARSVGLNTTATVAHSIVVILIKAAFAVAYPEIVRRTAIGHEPRRRWRH